MEVKSLSSKTFFLCQNSLTKPSEARFIVFVLVPTDPSKPPEYYILSNKQFLELVEEQKQISKELEAKRGRPYASFSFGISYKTIARHEFRDWNILPQ